MSKKVLKQKVCCGDLWTEGDARLWLVVAIAQLASDKHIILVRPFTKTREIGGGRDLEADAQCLALDAQVFTDTWKLVLTRPKALLTLHMNSFERPFPGSDEYDHILEVLVSNELAWTGSFK